MIADETAFRKMIAPRRVFGLLIAIGAAAVGFGWLERRSDAPPTDSSAKRPLDGNGPSAASPVTLIVSGDTAGWIVPCGCTSNQSGGLLRRGTYVAERRRAAPVIVADAGGAPGGTSPYQRTRFEAILDGEMAMGLAAHNIGAPEASLGIEYLRKMGLERNVPLISANLRDRQHRPLFDPCRIVDAGGIRVILIGVLKTYARLEGDKNWEIGDPRLAVLETLTAKQGKFDRAVVLAHLHESDLRDLAAALPEVDAVIGGPTGQSLAPIRIGPTLLASATNKGKFLVSVSLPTTKKTVELAAAVVEMSADLADDKAQEANVLRFRRELERRDFEASETGFAPELPAAGGTADTVAGNESCRTCHPSAFDRWRESGHAQAWETLVAEGTHVDSFCQQCHTTGYGIPGGFLSRGKTPDRVAVGCESCHGPSLAHVEKPEKHTPFAAREQCTRCHDRENSPQFEYTAYWKLIGHGRETRNGQ
jgi:hypothetical protein